ncbi:MAG: hypothetical protein ABIA21_01715 [Candidatus Aenigmatarchaeota archaeon]
MISECVKMKSDKIVCPVSNYCKGPKLDFPRTQSHVFKLFDMPGAFEQLYCTDLETCKTCPIYETAQRAAKEIKVAVGIRGSGFGSVECADANYTGKSAHR